MESQYTIKQGVIRVFIFTILLLLIPYVAMQISEEVNWKIGDFLIMGTLLFCSGLCYVLATRYIKNLVYRIAMGITIGSTLFLVWANLAVGLIGAGPHTGNLLYIGVVAVAVIGMIISRFSASGMERTLYGMALSMVLVAAIALLANMDEYPGSSVLEIIAVNGSFALLFALAGTLFRYVAAQQEKN